MKKSFVILCCLLCVAGGLFAQGIVFEKGSWQEVLEKARQENKILFVDVYTSWCGPCKAVAKNVFPQEKVGTYYNSHFINYQLDGEKGDGPALVKKYGIKAYPTFLYLDGDGKLLYCFSGAKDVKGFLEEAGKIEICARHGGWEAMQSKYKAGSTDPVFLKAYYELASRNEKPKVMNQYLMALPDDQLFVQEMGKVLEEDMTLYDYDLLMRLVKGRVRIGKQSADFDFVFTFPLQWKLTGLFNESIKEGDEKRFNELLELKRVYSALPGSLDGDERIIWGRGLYFATEDMLQLCYLSANKNDDARYKALLEVYLPRIMQQHPLNSLAARRKRSEEMLQTPMGLMFSDNLKESYQLFATYVIDWTDYYWRLSPSDKTHRERCAEWVNYACGMNPYNPVIPLKAAGLLVRLKHKKDAIAHLKTAIEKQKVLQGDPEKLPDYAKKKSNRTIKDLEDMLRDVQNDK